MLQNCLIRGKPRIWYQRWSSIAVEYWEQRTHTGVCFSFKSSNEQPENEIKKMLLTSASKTINLKNKSNNRSTGPVHWKLQNIAERNWRPKWAKDIQRARIRKTSCFKMQYSSNWSTDSVQSLVKSSLPFFAEIGKLILKLIWKCKGPRPTKIILQRRTKLEDSHFPMSKLTINKATVIKTV